MKDEIISIYAGAVDKLRSIDVATLLGESHVTDEIRIAHIGLVAEGTLLKFGRYYSLADSPQHEFPTTSGVRNEKLSTDSGHTAAPSDVSSPNWARPTKTKPLKQEKKTMLSKNIKTIEDAEAAAEKDGVNAALNRLQEKLTAEPVKIPALPMPEMKVRILTALAQSTERSLSDELGELLTWVEQVVVLTQDSNIDR